MRRREFIAGIAGVAVWPHAAPAQQTSYVMGYLRTGSPNTNPRDDAAFLQGLKEVGYIEGENLRIERGPEPTPAREQTCIYCCTCEGCFCLSISVSDKRDSAPLLV